MTEFAAALGRSTESGRRYLSHAVEGRYRLTSCWARLVAGELPAWRLSFIADRTMSLSPEAAAFVDAKVAPFAHTIGPAQLGRLIEEAKARFDPEATEAERLAAAEAGHFDIALSDVTVNGRVRVDGDVDLADALDLEAAVAADAHQQLLLGSTDSLDVRRAKAVGNLARNQHTLDLAEKTGQPGPRRRREVVLHVHLSEGRAHGCRRHRTAAGDPRPGHRRTGPRVVRQPGRPDHRAARDRPSRAPPRRLLRSLRPAQAPDPAPRPDLRVPLLLQTGRAVRLRAPGAARR